jgi:16S rRNA (guanine966-N2)-methyltransferase
MRIITGMFRGRRLLGPRGMELRPTSDRLKEALFNILAAEIPHSRVLDVFAGTGAIGLEALSRGAQQVVFIESSKAAVKLIRQNLEICGVTSGFRIIAGDVFTSLRAAGREGFQAEIAFMDPPYNWGPYRDLLELVFACGIAVPSTRVVVEHHRKALLPESGAGFQRERVVKQSDKCLSFYKKY